MGVKIYSSVKEVKQKTEVLKEVYCDTCGKLLCVSGENVKKHCSYEFDDEYERYYSVTKGYRLWDEDGPENDEHHYYCHQCLKKAYRKYMRKPQNGEFFEIKCHGLIHTYDGYSTEGLEVENGHSTGEWELENE